MLATPRRLLLALVALAAGTPELIAVMTCTPNGANSWTCVSDYYPPPYDPTDPDSPYTKPVTNTIEISFSTNIEFRCDSCSAMTPEECQWLKVSILFDVANIYNSVFSAVSVFDSSYSAFYGGLDWYVDHPEIYGDDIESTIDEIKGDLAATLDEAQFQLHEMRDMVDGATSSIRGLLNNTDCSSCPSQTIPVDIHFVTNVVVQGPSGGGGGSGSGGGGSDDPSSGGCCCKEELEAIFNILKNDFLPKVKRIDENVEKLKELIETAKKQLETTKTGFGNVTNLFNRLDDYVLDDFSNRVYQIRMDVNFIASNLADKVSSLFINNNYSNAVFYADNDGNDVVMSELKDKLVDEKNSEGKRFDFGEFGKLPWFTRIEFLLTDIAGYYDKTNSPVSEIEKLKKKVSDFEASSKSDNQSMSNKVEAIASDQMSSVNTALSRLWGYFSFFGSGGNSSIEGVEIMGGDLSDYFGEGSQSIHIYAFDDDDESLAKFDSFLEIVRYCFQALYLAGFSFVLFKLLLFLYAKIGLVINYLLKFYAAIFGSS